MKKWMLLAITTLLSISAFAKKSCDELKSEIDAKLKAKGVVSFTLEIVENSTIKDEKIIGSCDGGSKKITYLRK